MIIECFLFFIFQGLGVPRAKKTVRFCAQDDVREFEVWINSKYYLKLMFNSIIIISFWNENIKTKRSIVKISKQNFECTRIPKCFEIKLFFLFSIQVLLNIFIFFIFLENEAPRIRQSTRKSQDHYANSTIYITKYNDIIFTILNI